VSNRTIFLCVAGVWLFGALVFFGVHLIKGDLQW
jgi:hypothetical protein